LRCSNAITGGSAWRMPHRVVIRGSMGFERPFRAVSFHGHHRFNLSLYLIIKFCKLIHTYLQTLLKLVNILKFIKLLSFFKIIEIGNNINFFYFSFVLIFLIWHYFSQSSQFRLWLWLPGKSINFHRLLILNNF